MALIALCFGASALSRIADPGGAMANEVARLADTAEATLEESVAPPPSRAEIEALLDTVREREAQLDAEADRMAERSRLVEAAEARVRDQLKGLQDAESRLSELVRVAETASRDDVARLVAAYQSMGGKRAGPIFETMDDAFAAGLLSRMDNTAAADILAALTPEKAYAVTVYIAGQNARAPRE